MTLVSILYTVILYPLVQIIELSYLFFYKLFDTTGLAIIGVSFTVTLLCLPLYIVAEKWQQIERDKQKQMKFGIDRIKTAFKGDEQYMMLSTFYKQHHYHPLMAMRSSFGLLIQIPFFMAAYSCLSKLPSLQGQSFLFIKNLGQPDALFYISRLSINILPITMTLINITAGVIYTKGFMFKDKIQIYALALLFLVILYNSPSGLVLYWTMNNIFSLAKNIFYKLKNPLKVLYITLCTVIIFCISYLLFIYDANLKMRVILSLIILCFAGIPLYLKFIKWCLYVPLKSILQNFKIRFCLYIFSVIGITLLLGLVIPTTLISSSVQEFSDIGNVSIPTQFVKHTFFQVLGIFIFWSTCIYFLFGKKIQTLISIIYSCFFCISIINVYAFSGNYGSMDITLKFIGGIQSQTKIFIILNIIINILAILVIFIIVKLKKEKILSAFFILSSLVFIFISINNIFTIKTEYKSFISSKTENSNSNKFETKFNLTKEGKNVIVMMLDRAESSFFNYILEDNPQLKESFSGFTYYPNTISFNGHTLMGSPSLYGGYEYTPLEINKRKNETLLQKHNESLLVLPRIFSEQADFSVKMFDTSWANYSLNSDLSITKPYEKIHGENLKGRYTAEFKSSLPTIDNNTLVDSINRNLLFVSLFRSLPACFRPYIYFNGTWWGTSEVTNLDDFIDCYASLYYMNDLTDFKNQNNCFILLTNDCTHSNEDISSLKLTDSKVSFPGRNSGYEINLVSFEAISNWLEFLKENNCYDNTKIIIVADHGIGYGPSYAVNFETPDINGFQKDQLHPLLLVKDFNKKGNIKTDYTFMTNADTPLLALKDIITNPKNPFTGNQLNDENKKDGVIVTTENFYMPYHSKSENIFTIDKDSLYKVKDNIFIDKNWQQFKGDN